MKKGEYVSMRTLKQTLPYLTVSLTILYAFMRIYKFYNPFAFPGIEERISLILVPCLLLTFIFYFPFQKVEKQIKAMSDRLRKFPFPRIEKWIKAILKRFPFQKIEKQLKPITDRLREKVPKPTFIQKRARFNVFKLKFPKKFNIRKSISSENCQEALIKYLFLVFLVIIALLEIAPISQYLSFLTNFKTHLFVLTIVFGVVTFWQNREVIAEVEKEAIEEQKQEEKRKEEFAGKFPGINKIPIFRSLVKWVYKEGWEYSLSIIIIGLTIFLIKTLAGTWNSPQGQFHQIRVALGIIRTGLPIMDSGVIYLRAIPFSYMLAGSIKIFGFNVVGMRFPSVLFSVLTSFILYIILKQSFNKNIGFLGFAFFNFLGISFSPYLTHRFYSMGWFFIYLSLFFLIQCEKEYSKKGKYLFFICSLCSIVVTKIGLITIPLYFLKSIFSYDWKKIPSWITDKYFFLYIVLVLILYKYSLGYIVPSYIIIGNFTKLSFSSNIYMIRDNLLFVYFLKRIFYSWGLWFVLGFLGTFIYVLKSKQKKMDNPLTYLLALIIIGYISISILSPFKQQPRILFFMIPAMATIIVFPFGILLYDIIKRISKKKRKQRKISKKYIKDGMERGVNQKALKKNMFLIIIFALALAIIINPISIKFGLSGGGGDEIPESCIESHSFRYILAWKDQVDYLNTQYHDGDWVFTSNRWIDFYFKGDYSLIVTDVMDSRLYQIYQGNQRYLMTNVVAYYRYNKLGKKIIEVQSANNSVYFVEFPDFLSNLKRVDKNDIFLRNAELIYDGPGQYDRIWKIKQVRTVRYTEP